VPALLQGLLQPQDVVLTQGAGDTAKLAINLKTNWNDLVGEKN